MAKKIFVLYSLKEFMVPKIFKTKATLNKYLEKNNNYIFKQFYDQEEAYQFSKQIEKQMEHKFHIKVEEHTQTSFIDQRVQSSLNVEKQRQEQNTKNLSDQETQRIIDEIVIGKAIQKEVKTKKQTKQQEPVIQEKTNAEINVMRKEINDIKQEIEKKFEKQYELVPEVYQQIKNKQSQENQKSKILEEPNITIQVKQLTPKLQKIQEQAVISVKEVKQALQPLVLQENIILSEIPQKIKPKIQQTMNQKLKKIQEIKQPLKQQTQIEKEFTLLNQTLFSLPQVSLNMYQFSLKQNQTNFLQNHPLHKNYLNLPFLNIESKLLEHFSKYTKLLLQENNESISYDSPSTLKIFLSQKQNPGLAVVKYIFLTSRGQFKKMQMLGVKNKNQIQVLSLIKGLQMAKFYEQKNLKIETTFNLKSVDKYKNSIDKSIREHTQNYLNLEQEFKKIEYL